MSWFEKSFVWMIALFVILAVTMRWAGIDSDVITFLAGNRPDTSPLEPTFGTLPFPSASPVEPAAPPVGDLSQLFQAFLLYLEVVMAVAFGIIVFLQWRESQRQSAQQEAFTNYVTSSSEFMDNASGLLSSMQAFMDMQERNQAKTSAMESQLQERIDKTKSDEAIVEKELSDNIKTIDGWAQLFNRNFHRHQRDSYTRLKAEFEDWSARAATFGLQPHQLCPEYSLIAGIYKEKIRSLFLVAIKSYIKAKDLADPEDESRPRSVAHVQAAIRRNLGLCYHFVGEYDKANELFLDAASEYPLARDLYVRLSLQTQLLKARAQFKKNEITEIAFIEEVKRLKVEFQELERVEFEQITSLPLEKTEHRAWLAYWYVSLLMHGTEPDDFAIAERLLGNGRLAENWSIINSLKIGFATKVANSTDIDAVQRYFQNPANLTTFQNPDKVKLFANPEKVKQYIVDCRVELRLETNHSERITLMMRMLRFLAFLKNREKWEDLRDDLRGELALFRQSGEKGVLIFSVISDCYCLPDQIEKELDDPRLMVA